MKTDKPLVGVSRCLLGDAVRYDGDSKPDRLIIEKLSQLFRLIPVCPEVEAGLSIPRPPVQLTGNIENPKLTGRDDPAIDVTDIMLQYCRTKPGELKQLAGFIFKSRSPSCGLHSTPVFIDGQRVTDTARGIFTRHFCRVYPDIPVIEDQDLEDERLRDQFILSIMRSH